MTKPYAPLLFALALLALTPRAAQAGPWLHDAGSGYVQLASTYFTSTEGVQGAAANGFRYRKTTLSLYGEVGLPAGLQLTANLPFEFARNDAAEGGAVYTNRGVGDVRVALDARLLSRPALTFGVEVKAPGYRDPSEQSSVRGLADDDLLLIPITRFPSIGDNNIDVTPRVQLGHSFYPLAMWAQVELGYRVRTCQRHGSGACQEFRDGLALSGSLGWMPLPDRLSLELYSSGYIAIETDGLGNDSLGDDRLPTQEFLYLQGKLSLLELPPSDALALTFGVGGIPYGHNTQSGMDVTLAISTNF